MSDETAGRLQKVQRLPTTASLELVTVDVGALGASATVDLPGLGANTITRVKVDRRGPGEYTWFGKLGGADAILVVEKGDVTGEINTPTTQFTITPLGGGLHALVKIDPSKFPPDHPHNPPMGPRDTSAPPPASGRDATRTSPVVDVLVAYTTAAKTAQGGTITTLIQQAVDQANAAYTASNAGMQLRLVGSMEISYTESTFDAAVAAAVAGTGPFAAVHTRRDQLGADVVSVMLNLTAFCGLASSIKATEANAYSTLYWNCVSNKSFQHEIGHLVGSRHDPFVDNTSTPYAYGHGYIVPSNAWRTIMAYVNGCGSCPRQNFFSNPSINFMSAPTGTTAIHDNARVHRERAAAVAAFRTAVGANKQTAAKCNVCFTCGGDWPVFAGMIRSNPGSPTERGSACGGGLITGSDSSPYLCCR